VSINDRKVDERPTQKSEFRVLSQPSVTAGLPRKEQVPQSRLSEMIPRGQNLTGMKLKSR